VETFDAAVIGAGLLGCFTARALARTALSCVVLEAREDVCTGVSKANSGIVYTGLDAKPGTLKAALCVRANRDFDRLCRELDVPFRRCGSLLVFFGARGEAAARKKLAQGLANGVPGLSLLGRDELLRREPRLSPAAAGALFAPGTGTVEPWALGIAAYENAAANGVSFRFGEPVAHMARTGDGFELETARAVYRARAVVNCAGLRADWVRELVEPPKLRLFPTGGDYLVLEEGDFVRHVIFHEMEEGGKGLTLTPAVDGALLAGPTERPCAGSEGFPTTREGLELLYALCRRTVPALPLERVIRSFGAVRPRPYYVTGRDGAWTREDRPVESFPVLEEDGLISLLGIKTPGLTCAPELGALAARRAAAYLRCDAANPDFSPVRRGIQTAARLDEAARAALVRERPEYGEIVCRCRQISRGEILEAARRGAATLDGVKRRVGAGMGPCQGSRCGPEIERMLRHGAV